MVTGVLQPPGRMLLLPPPGRMLQQPLEHGDVIRALAQLQTRLFEESPGVTPEGWEHVNLAMLALGGQQQPARCAPLGDAVSLEAIADGLLTLARQRCQRNCRADATTCVAAFTLLNNSLIPPGGQPGGSGAAATSAARSWSGAFHGRP